MQISNAAGANNMNQSVFTGARSIRFNPNDMQEKMRAQNREAKLREREDEMIKNLQKSITVVSKSGLDQDTIDAQVESLSAQIQTIYDNRAEREKQAREAELQKQKEAAEEVKRKQEENRGKNGAAEPEEEGAISRQDMEGMVKLAVSHEGISALKKTKASMAMEAEQLSQDIANDSRADGNDFRQSHLERLNAGIGNLEKAVNEKVADLNREANEMMEDEPAKKPGEEEDTETEQTQPIPPELTQTPQEQEQALPEPAQTRPE